MNKNKFTLCELLFCFAVAVLLVVVISTAAEAAVAKAKAITCQERLHGILTGVLTYASSNGDHIPPAYEKNGESRRYFVYILRDYVSSSSWLCPDQRMCAAFFNGTRVNNGIAVGIAETAAAYKVSYGYSEAYDGFHDYREYSPCQGIDITMCVSPTILFGCSNNTQAPMFECGPYAAQGKITERGGEVVPRSTKGIGTCRLGMKYLHRGDTGNFGFSDGHVETLADTTFNQWMSFL